MPKNPPKVPEKPKQNSLTDDIDSTFSYNDNDPMRIAYEDSIIGREHFVLPAGLRPKSTKNFNENNDENETDATLIDSKSQRLATFKRLEPDLVGKDR